LSRMTLNVKEQKQLIRERIWRLLEEKKVALFPRPVYGRIPNFAGAEIAAQRLLSLKVWEKGEVVKSNPDSPQVHVREQALREGKTVVMATPRLLNGFLVLKPGLIEPYRIREAATIKGAFKYGRRVPLGVIPSHRSGCNRLCRSRCKREEAWEGWWLLGARVCHSERAQRSRRENPYF